MRGFGLSDLGSGDHSIADMADDVAALLDALKLPAATVGGMSMGRLRGVGLSVAIAIDCSPLYWPTQAAADSPRCSPVATGRHHAGGNAGRGSPTRKCKFTPVGRPRPVSLRAEVRRLGTHRPMPSCRDPRLARPARPHCRAARDRSAHSWFVGGHPGRAFPARGRPGHGRFHAQGRVVEIPGAGHLSTWRTPTPSPPP